MRIKDELGNTYSKLHVVSFAGVYLAPSGKYSVAQWNCKCQCGNHVVVRGSCLRNGQTTSCGCAIVEGVVARSTTHGLSHDPTYISWAAMKARCTNEELKSYPRYGGLGITYDPEWEFFEGFVRDMGSRPQNTSLDRVDFTQGYSKANCRWADKSTQAYNQKIRCTNTSGVTGVYPSPTPGKWVARLHNKHIGTFLTRDAAIEARFSAEQAAYGVSRVEILYMGDNNK